MTKTSIPSYKESDRDYLSATNAWKPVFYKAAVEGKNSVVAFPDDGAKRFYVECLKGAFSNLPIQLVAYSVINNRAYFVIGSWDQAPVSFLRYLEAANQRYSVYYCANYINSGTAFKDKIRYKKIKDESQIVNAIAIVHGQPAATRLCRGYNDYEFTSYNEIAGKGLSTLLPLYQLFGQEQVAADYMRAHNYPPLRIPPDFLPLPKQDNFDIEFENCLINFKCYDKNNIPKSVLPKIVIDLNDKCNYYFDFIVESLLTRKQEKYELLVTVLAEMSVRLRYTYDEALSRLGVASNDNMLIMDIVIYINNELSYSYDYIMGMLGLAYPNLPFYRDLLNYMCTLKGLDKIQAMKKLGITDQGMLGAGLQ
ncbi:MAG: hypothetical protein PHI19_05000 [Clostridia bacterium]|nr:hypothetical protein [Clostridia bacterium]